MERPPMPKNDQSDKNKEEEEIIIQDDEFAKLMQSLPVENYGNDGLIKIIKYQGFWLADLTFKQVLAFQKHFQARDSDIIVTSFPKTGNTWLKSLLFAIVNRNNANLNNLLQKHPHEIVCHLENDVYGKAFDYPQPRHLNQLSSPRLFSTHLSYHSLPESIRTSNCRILYLTRNPLDTFVSYYHFLSRAIKNIIGDGRAYQLQTVEEYFERQYVEGKTPFGPFLDHVKQYKGKSLEQPNKIMFLMYEDLKDELVTQVKRIAEFIGFSFSAQEESEGVVEKIVDLCDFNNLKELEVNKNGVINKFFEKKSYFRKGKVGDWTNHLTPEMGNRLIKCTEEQVCGSGLSFIFKAS